MEIKEAVGILKGLQEPEVWEPQITEKTFEALDMAIIALERSDDKSRFFTLEYDFQYSIKVDRDTGVMYAVSNGNNNAGTFTPLINADGKPLIYKEIIKESDLVKMGVIEPGEIKAGQVGPIEQLERKRGEWIDYTEDGYVECPFCHSATNCDGNKDELHFCFSCGADMRGEKDG